MVGGHPTMATRAGAATDWGKMLESTQPKKPELAKRRLSAQVTWAGEGQVDLASESNG